MKQYIDKDDLVAEIEGRIKVLNEKLIKHPISSPTLEKLIEENKKVLSLLDTLEVKDVDLEKEFDKCCKNHIFDDECEVYTARRFFELGLKAKGE